MATDQTQAAERPTRAELEALTPEQIRERARAFFAAQPDSNMADFDGDGTSFEDCFAGWVGYETPTEGEPGALHKSTDPAIVHRAHVEATLTMVSFVADAS